MFSSATWSVSLAPPENIHRLWQSRFALSPYRGLNNENFKSLSGAFHESDYHKKNMGMIKEATAGKVRESVLDEKYGVASIGMQLKMLMWRASIAKYKVQAIRKGLFVTFHSRIHFSYCWACLKI